MTGLDWCSITSFFLTGTWFRHLIGPLQLQQVPQQLLLVSLSFPLFRSNLSCCSKWALDRWQNATWMENLLTMFYTAGGVPIDKALIIRVCNLFLFCLPGIFAVTPCWRAPSIWPPACWPALSFLPYSVIWQKSETSRSINLASKVCLFAFYSKGTVEFNVPSDFI